MNPTDVYKSKPTSIPEGSWNNFGDFACQTVAGFVNITDANIIHRRCEDIRNATTKHIYYCYEMGYDFDHAVIFDD